ncbi:hypothetical protein D3C87_130370 [compost metagenome]
MDIQYNYQIRIPSDKRDWDEIEAIQRIAADRVLAIQYGRRLARVFNAEVRMTDGSDHLNTSGTYLKDEIY